MTNNNNAEYIYILVKHMDSFSLDLETSVNICASYEKKTIINKLLKEVEEIKKISSDEKIKEDISYDANGEIVKYEIWDNNNQVFIVFCINKINIE